MSINNIAFKGIHLFRHTAPNKKGYEITHNNKQAENQTQLYDTPCLNKIVFSRDINLGGYPKHKRENYQACLLGGAIGDALGAPVEFMRLSDIKARYGKKGITELEKFPSGKAKITDDTQMTMFTADGLLKSAITKFDDNENPDMDVIYDSYQNWLDTQYGSYKESNTGWISNIKDLWAARAPGLTCTGALRGGVSGSIEKPVNQSKGCGGVMRTAPVGLMYYKNPKKAFEIGARCAALTHGGPGAYLPAGIHASIIADIVGGKNIQEAVDNSIETLKEYKGHKETLELMEAAKILAQSDIDSETAIKYLGEGWHGDEAIAISVYCALKSPDDFEKAVTMAVNHSGDSDSTGAITGNILGAYLGEDKIPAKWKNEIELRDELIQVADDLYTKPNKIKNSDKRYPSPIFEK